MLISIFGYGKHGRICRGKDKKPTYIYPPRRMETVRIQTTIDFLKEIRWTIYSIGNFWSPYATVKSTFWKPDEEIDSAAH